MTITLLRPDGVPLTAQQHRQGLAALNGGGPGRPLGGRSGFRVGTPTNVLTATSTTWTLQPCSAMIDPGHTTHQGMYGWATDQNLTGDVTAADVTYGRKDIVYIQVNDSSAGDGSGALSAPVLYAAGTPSATPAAPSLPERSFLVGTITVPKVGAGSPTVALNSARFVAAGGILPVYSVAERDGLDKYDSLTVRRMDVAGRPTETWNGSTWLSGSTSAPYAEAWGTSIIAIDSGGNFGAVIATFPAGRFTVPPKVNVAISNGPGGSQSLIPRSYLADKDKCTVALYNAPFSAGVPNDVTVNVDWHAVQMTPTSAAG